jgi:hypothetical protein
MKFILKCDKAYLQARMADTWIFLFILDNNGEIGLLFLYSMIEALGVVFENGMSHTVNLTATCYINFHCSMYQCLRETQPVLLNYNPNVT